MELEIPRLRLNAGGFRVSSFRCRTVMRGTLWQTDSGSRVSALRRRLSRWARVCGMRMRLCEQGADKSPLRTWKALLSSNRPPGLSGGLHLQGSGVSHSNSWGGEVFVSGDTAAARSTARKT